MKWTIVFHLPRPSHHSGHFLDLLPIVLLASYLQILLRISGWLSVGSKYSRTALIPDACYPDRLGHWDKFVQNFSKLTCLEITGYLIKYSTVLWLQELEIWRGRKV